MPCVAPCVNESGLFSDPEFTARFAVISAIVVAFKLSISSLPIISTGEAPSVGLPLMYEPVTTTSSTASSLSCATMLRELKMKRIERHRTNNFFEFCISPPYIYKFQNN